jgi:uncharacterized protein
MLSFDIRSLESQAVVVDEELPATDDVWQEHDLKPATAVHVTGRLSPAGPGRFYWHGRIEGDVALECSRCLTDTRAPVSDEAHVIFAETGYDDTDDPDVYQLDPANQELDLRPAIREEWLLAAPSFAVCRDDCKGLCPRCGSDLNELNGGTCSCEDSQADSRWNALRKLDPSER